MRGMQAGAAAGRGRKGRPRGGGHAGTAGRGGRAGRGGAGRGGAGRGGRAGARGAGRAGAGRGSAGRRARRRRRRRRPPGGPRCAPARPARPCGCHKWIAARWRAGRPRLREWRERVTPPRLVPSSSRPPTGRAIASSILPPPPHHRPQHIPPHFAVALITRRASFPGPRALGGHSRALPTPRPASRGRGGPSGARSDAAPGWGGLRAARGPAARRRVRREDIPVCEAAGAAVRRGGE
jgi:hypothetical protein